jgi:hypothetical protein
VYATAFQLKGSDFFDCDGNRFEIADLRGNDGVLYFAAVAIPPR